MGDGTKRHYCPYECFTKNRIEAEDGSITWKHCPWCDSTTPCSTGASCVGKVGKVACFNWPVGIARDMHDAARMICNRMFGEGWEDRPSEPPEELSPETIALLSRLDWSDAD